jgi:hypothetical protein
MTEQGKVHGSTFGKVPPELMHDQSITDGAVRLYAHMHWRYGQNHQNFEGQRSMAKYLSVSTTTIRKRIEELEAKDWVVTITREYNRKTGNFSTPFYHVFVSQPDCKDFRETYVLQEGEVLYEQPIPLERKSRKGVGGKSSNLPNRANSSSHGHDNSSYNGGTNSGSHGQANSSSHYPESVYPDSSNPEPIKEKAVSPFVLMKNAICKAFGWDKPTDTEWGQINKSASQLVKVDIDPDDIASLYGFCKVEAKENSFTPLFLASKASTWKKQRPRRVVPDRPIEIVQPVVDDSPPPTPEQIEQYKADYLAMVASKNANSKPYNWRDYLPPGFNLDKEAV